MAEEKKYLINTVNDSVEYMSLLRQKIFSRELSNLKDIQDYIYKTYDIHSQLFDINRYLVEALTAYIIECETDKIIPECNFGF